MLEGSIRKAGSTIRITAQLIDAQTDKHLWSQTYDRELTVENVFAVQDEIATAIVAELSKSLQVGLDAGRSAHAQPGTRDIDAYQLYLRAQQRFRIRSFDNLPGTIDLFRQVVQLDPEFAAGWASLAAALYVAPGWGLTDSDYLESAVAAANKALRLDDSLSLPYAVLAEVETESGRPDEYLRAFELFDKALDRDPNDATTLLWRAIDYTIVGYFEPAIADLSRCLELEPGYPNCERYLALVNLYTGKEDEAIRLFELGLQHGATSQFAPFVQAYAARGDYRSVLFLLQMEFLGDDRPYSLDRRYRAITDPHFDFERERREFEIEYKVATDTELDWSSLGNQELLQLRKFDALSPDKFTAVWWYPGSAQFKASPHRKRLIREIGAYDYWLAKGFPPQCRPLGDDDFECD